MDRFSQEFYGRLQEKDAPQRLHIAQGHILPAYKDQSILNLPASICRWFGIPAIHHSPFTDDILHFTDKQFKRIVVILIDGLSYRHFQSMLSKKQLPVWTGLLTSGIFTPISSVAPSTTSTAITTLWTGHSPAEHAVIGYELWLKEYGIVTNMISQSPISYSQKRSSIENAGFQPEETLEMRTLGQHLHQHDIASYSLQHFSIASSGLSRTFLKNTHLVGYNTESELWENLLNLLTNETPDRLFAWIYWGAFDYLAHRYGPEDIRAQLGLVNFSDALEKNFIHRIPSHLKQDTLLIMTADHGQIYTLPNPHYYLKNHPGLTNALHINPTGENRLSFLHVKPGKLDTVRTYFEENWPGEFDIYASNWLLEHGLFGPGQPHELIWDRIGDLTVIPRNDNYLWWSVQENKLLGRHGGLSSSEMVVPLLATVL